MELVLARNVWGLCDDPAAYPEAIPLVAAAGYGALAAPVQVLADDRAFGEALVAHGLRYVAQVFTFGSSIDDHLAMFRSAVERCATLSPMHVVAQAGRDCWVIDDSVRFLREAVTIAEGAGVRVLHETHRSRILYAPWAAERVLDQLPLLQLACDLSHWTCVSESTRISSDLLAAMAPNVGHVDARVGWEEGPQVPDPRAPLYAGHLATFEGWWDQLWKSREASGAESLVMMPEFGPPPYQPVHPATGEPLADVNELNDWMAGRLRERFAPD